jgi:hypothetical protein
MMLSAAEQNKNVKTAYPVASAILMDAYRYLGSLDEFSFDAITTNDDIFRGVMLQEFTHRVHVDILRPDKLQIHVSGDIKNKSIYFSNDVFTVINHDLNFYGELQIPKTVDSALDYLFEKYEIKAPLANLLYTDLDKRISPKENGHYFGTTWVDGKICHYIGFVNDQRELQVWIEKGQTPLIRKFSIIDKSGKFDLRSTTLLRWDIKPNFKKTHFLFNAPKDAEKISVLPKGSN